MKRFVEGLDRGQSTLFPECLGDWVGEDNAVRVIETFVEALDLGELGFVGVDAPLAMSSVVMRRFEGFCIMPLHPQKGAATTRRGTINYPAIKPS